MELGHVLLDYLDGLVTILRLHNLRPRMLLKHHLHRRKNKRLVIDQQYLIARAILKIIILIILIAVFDYLIRLPQALRWQFLVFLDADWQIRWMQSHMLRLLRLLSSQLLSQLLIQFNFGANIYWKARTFTQFASHNDFKAHLINNFFANTQAQTRPLRINILMLLQLPKINKQFVDIFRRYADAGVFDLQRKLDILSCLLRRRRTGRANLINAVFLTISFAYQLHIP